MDLGVLMFPTDLAIQPVALAKAAEERGFASLWFPEHTHIPVSRRSPWPGGKALPEEYKRTHDPFVALAACAAATTTLRFGTGIALVAQRDPIVTAKAVASLDVISEGRFTFGVGVGWNEEEMEDHGVDPKRRRSIVREKVLAMKALWTEDEASFAGEHVAFEAAWSWPKPVQRPHPPIYLGGAGGPITFRHVVEWCDGWMPIAGRSSIADKLPALRQAAEEAGRDPATIGLKAFGVPGTPEALDGLQALGVNEALLGLPAAAPDVVLPLLDRYAALLAG